MSYGYDYYGLTTRSARDQSEVQSDRDGHTHWPREVRKLKPVGLLTSRDREVIERRLARVKS